MNMWEVGLVGCGLKIGASWEVGPKNRCEMGGWPPKQVGNGNLAPKICVRWEVGLKNVSDGRLAPKNISDGRLVPKTGGRWEVGPQNRWEMGG